MPKTPQISIVIATKNEKANIERCLKSIKKQSIRAHIIVVDNFSQDKTVELAKKYTKFVYQVGPERTKQRNFGLKRAQGKYILFIDADMELESGLLEECLSKMSSKTSGIIIDEVSVGNTYLAKIKALEKQLYTGHTEIEAARFFNKYDLQAIGGYDENLISGEDWDLHQRIQKRGKLGRVKKHILHHENQSLFEDVAKKYYYAKHIQKYARLHPQSSAAQFSPIKRLSIIFGKPHLLLRHPLETTGLIVLKSLHFSAYLAARIRF